MIEALVVTKVEVAMIEIEAADVEDIKEGK